mgnify:CR=1 FL=1
MIRINLLPVEQTKKWELGQKQIVLFLLVLIGVAAGNWAWQSGVKEGLERKQRQVQRIRQDIAQLDKVIAEVKNIGKEKEAIELKLGVLADLRKARTGPVKLLDNLAEIIPERTWLETFKEEEGNLTLVGGAVNNEDLADFIRALKESAFFKEPTLKRSVRTGGKGGPPFIVFELNCGVDYTA